jgi:hypothetical protein
MEESGGKWGILPIVLVRNQKDEKTYFRPRKDYKIMCQAAPGPRCYNDTSKVLRTRSNKIASLDAKLVDANKALAAAMSSSMNFTAYGRASKSVKDLTAKRDALVTERRHDRRDAYGTKTGAKKLAQRIKNASTETEAESLRKLGVQAEALRFSREHALSRKREGYVPAIRFAGAQAA